MKLKIDTAIVKTYLLLNNKRADEYLLKLSQQIRESIKASSDNDEIFEYLVFLDEFLYKVPRVVVEITDYLIKKAPADPLVHKTALGDIPGKNHKELLQKCLELLNKIRYISPDEVLRIISSMSNAEDDEIKGKALEVVKNFARYDYYVLTKSRMGYGPQRKILDFILGWPVEERVRHYEFVETATRELLNSSVEGTTMTSPDTISVNVTAVTPTKFLKQIRKETIDLSFDLYKASEDTCKRVRTVQIIDRAAHSPLNLPCGEDLKRMIVGDITHMSRVYRKMLFTALFSRLKANMAVVQAVDHSLKWIAKREPFRTRESEKLRKDIMKNEAYKLFRLFVGDTIDYKDDEGWETTEDKRASEIVKLIDSIEHSNLKEWASRLNGIAEYYGVIEEWKYEPFKKFLRKLTESKPGISDMLLGQAFSKNMPLKRFADDFLKGFRMKSEYDMWDKYVAKITAEKDHRSTIGIVYSLIYPDNTDLEQCIREDDIVSLEQIIRKGDRFAYLKEDDYVGLHLALINALARIHKRSPERVETLIREEIDGNPIHLVRYLKEFPYFIRRGWIRIEDLHEDTVSFLKEKMIEISDIDWHTQELLLALGKRCGLGAVLDVFMGRIRKDAERPREERLKRDKRYETIPHDFNSALADFISSNPDYKECFSRLLADMTADWSLYNWHIVQFLEGIGKQLDEIIGSLIERGDADSLRKAARALDSIEGVNYGLCLEIVRRTNNKEIVDLISARIYNTGAVWGEYGMAEVHEGRAKDLEKYMSDENEDVRKFVDSTIKMLLDEAKRERQSVDEERQLRKVEFEG